MIKKIFKISIWILLLTGVIVALGFAQKNESKQLCKDFKINIAREGENYFVEEDDIRQLLKDKGDSVIGQQISALDVNKIEKIVLTNPWVANADVCMSIDGILQIDIKQRNPILRIINVSGESYYIDKEGKLMLWSDDFTPRILVANGQIHETFNIWYNISIDEIKKSDTLTKVTILDDLFDIAQFISTDNFWNAQVPEIFLNAKGEIELVPQVGAHKIIFGDVSDIEGKFAKLKTFYSQGLNYTGWNLYDTINLKYKNQVICTKINQNGNK